MKKMFNTILENGIVISLFLGLAYLFAFQYQKGKLSYYGIPLSYVDLSLESVIEISFTILMVLYSIFLFLRPILDISKDAKSYHATRLINISIYFVIMFSINLSIIKKFNISLAIIIAMYIGFFVYALVAPLVSIREKIQYSEKWTRYSEKAQKNAIEEYESNEKGYYFILRNKIVKLTLLLCGIVFLCSMFSIAGKENAKDTTTFYVANDYNDKIIVHNNSDYYVLMELENNKLLDTYQIVPSNEIGTITMKKLGKLLIADIKDKNEKTLSNLYLLTKNEDNTYSYKFYDLNNSILFQKENVVREPNINQIAVNVYELKTQTGTGLSTNWAVYCDVEKSKTSETFYYVLGAQDDYVVCADYKDGKHFITIQYIFDKSVYYKTYELENVSHVAADFALGCKFDGDNNAIITYLIGEEYNETKITIDIL